MFRANGKTNVNFMSIFVSKPALLLQSRVGQILTISDFKQVTIFHYFRPALWLGWTRQLARRGWAGLGWPGGWMAVLGGGQTKGAGLGYWHMVVNGGSTPLPVVRAWINVVK